MPRKNKGGRPRVYKDRTIKITFSIPEGLAAALDRALKKTAAASESRLVSRLISDGLKREGLITAKQHQRLQPVGVDDVSE